MTDPASAKSLMSEMNAAALAAALAELETVMPTVVRALAALPLTEMTASETLCWWTAANGWLDNRRPIDVLEEDPAAVERAAAHLAEPSPL